MTKTFLALLFIISIFGCAKEKEEDIKEKPKPRTLIIGHKATGSGINNIGLFENSFEAVQYGCTHLDGIELDLQMSKDTTLWLTHYFNMTDCDGNTAPIFSLADTTIEKISACNTGTLITIEKLFEYLSKLKKKSFVTFDMKVIGNQNCNIANKSEKVADILINLCKKYKPNATIAVESFDINFLEIIEQKTKLIDTYLLVWYVAKENEIIYAKNKGIDGISCRYLPEITEATMAKARELNIKIQMWTLLDVVNTNNALKLNPYAIQIDSISNYLY